MKSCTAEIGKVSFIDVYPGLKMLYKNGTLTIVPNKYDLTLDGATEVVLPDGDADYLTTIVLSR